MKFQKETLVLFLNIIISFYIGFFLWDYIKFNFKDPEIIGFYSINKHNALNDIARYLIFISLPLLSYCLTKLYFDKDFLIKIKSFFININYTKNRTDQTSLSVLLCVLFILFLEFLSISFPENKLDSFHDGQKLSSAFKSFLDGSLWSGSFVTTGIFLETLNSKIIWYLFDDISIGLARYSEILLIFFFKISLTFFIYYFTNFLKLDFSNKNIFFIFNSLVLNYLSDYLPGVDLINFRELPIIFLSIFFLFLIRNNNHIIFLFFISLLSTSSLIWGIDRGLICNLLIVVILIYLILLGEFRKSLVLLFLIFISWLGFFIFFKGEFFYFLDNTLIVFKEMNYVHGLIHPKPFTNDPNSARATKTILSIVLITIISLNLIINSNKNYSVHLKRVLFFLALISISSYLYALGRSDGPHIKNSFGYPLIFLCIYLSYNFILIISKKKIKYLNSIFIILSFIMFATFQINFKKILSYDDRLYRFINLEDKSFLSDKELNLVNKLKPIVKDYDCIQLLSNDAALYYLLRKKSCTKYYYVWSASSKSTQKKLINELKDTNLIIEGGDKNNWDIPLEKKLHLVYQEIKDSFYEAHSIDEWKVFLRQ